MYIDKGRTQYWRTDNTWKKHAFIQQEVIHLAADEAWPHQKLTPFEPWSVYNFTTFIMTHVTGLGLRRPSKERVDDFILQEIRELMRARMQNRLEGGILLKPFQPLSTALFWQQSMVWKEQRAVETTRLPNNNAEHTVENTVVRNNTGTALMVQWLEGTVGGGTTKAQALSPEDTG